MPAMPQLDFRPLRRTNLSLMHRWLNADPATGNRASICSMQGAGFAGLREFTRHTGGTALPMNRPA